MRKFLALGLVVLAVLALWSTGWFFAAGEVKRQMAQLGEADGETAPRLTCGTLNVSGYPFRLDIECADAALLDQDLSLTLAGLKASVLAYSPTHVVFSAQAPLTLANAFTGSQSRVDFTGFEGSARLKTDDMLKGLGGAGWRIARVSAVADSVTWNETVLGDLLQLTARHVEAHLVDMPERHDKTAGSASLAAYAEVKDLAVPALAIAAGNASLEAELSGLPDDLQAFGDPDFLKAWQQRGGKLRLARLAGSQPQPDESFDITGEASLNAGGPARGRNHLSHQGRARPAERPPAAAAARGAEGQARGGRQLQQHAQHHRWPAAAARAAARRPRAAVLDV